MSTGAVTDCATAVQAIMQANASSTPPRAAPLRLCVDTAKQYA
jgi:hypothetical protein